MKIIIDAMGGDNAPEAPVRAGVQAASQLPDVEIVLVGREAVIKGELEKYSADKSKIEVVNAEDVISNYDEPARAVRGKKNASLVVAANLLKNGGGDALLSMGNTGALLSAGLLIVGRIKGVLRPAIGTLLPTDKGPKMLIDAGANTNCKPENLLQFAVMGDIYMNKVMGIDKPRVSILSNGEEEGKGDELVKAAYPLMKNAGFNFVGNMEGRDIMEGNADVFACDGFVGNVVLKTIEGMGSVVGKMIKELFTKSFATKIGAVFVLKGVKDFRKKMDYREYGGAPLLGTKKPVIKGHGSSDATAVFHAILQARKFVAENVIDDIAERINAAKEVS